MNQACFTAYSFDLEGSENAVHDYKGCSAFSQPTESCSSLPVPDSDDVTTCKSTCDTNGCNNVTPQKTNACYTCDVTIDSNNNVIGVGNEACFHNPLEGDLEFCSQPDAKCVTEMLVDWKLRGMQQFRVMRGCQTQARFRIIVLFTLGRGAGLYLSDYLRYMVESIFMKHILKLYKGNGRCL